MDIQEEEEIEEALDRLIDSGSYREIKALLIDLNSVDLARLLSDVKHDVLAKIFRLLPKELASETFIEMDADQQEYLIASFSDTELKEVIDDLFVDDTVDLIEEMPAHIVKRIMKSADKEMRESINKILNYPKDSAGSIMTTEYVNLEVDMSVEQAIHRIRKTGIDKETIYSCYVTDKANRLIGIISVRTLLLAKNSDLIGDIMQENVIFASTHDDKEETARQISRYGFLALPVCDNEQRLVGIVTADDAMDILNEEQTEDISIMSGATPLSQPYLKTSVLRIWLARAPWLLILMISATFTGLIITANESVLSDSAISIILMASIPMLMDTAGNAGSQASATIIRGIALDEIRFKDVFRVLLKEFLASMLLGLTLSIACFLKLMAVDRLFKADGGFMIAFVISVSMFMTVMVSKIIGCSLPMLAKKCKLDPAVVAGPAITTIVDAISLIIYCRLAIGLLSGLF